MPRLSASRSKQVEGGSKFKFQGGPARIVGMYSTLETIPGFSDVQCAVAVELLPLDSKWQPTGGDPITDIQLLGNVMGISQQTGEQIYGFHPGRATGPDDLSSEFGAAGDLGDVDPVPNGGDPIQGEIVLTWNGKGALRTSAAMTFMNSMEASGVNPKLIDNFYLPAFVGMEAEFCQQMADKKSSKGKDITSLIVGRGGKVLGRECVHKYPDASGLGAAASGNVPAKPVAAATGGASNTAPAPNGAPAAPTGGDGDAEAYAIKLLQLIGSEAKGQKIPRKKLSARLAVNWARLGVPAVLQTRIKELVKDEDWFPDKADDLGWVVTGTHDVGEVQIPS